MQVSRKSEKRYMLLFLFCVLYSFKLVMCIESWFIQPIANFRLQHTCLLYRLATSLPWIGWTLVLFHFSMSMTKTWDYADCDIGEDIISLFFSLSMLFSTLSFFPFSARYFTFYIFYHLRILRRFWLTIFSFTNSKAGPETNEECPLWKFCENKR